MKNAYNRANAHAMEAAMVNVQYDQMKDNIEDLTYAVEFYEWICADNMSRMSGSFILWLAHAQLPHASIMFARAVVNYRDNESSTWFSSLSDEWNRFNKTLPDGFDLEGVTADH